MPSLERVALLALLALTPWRTRRVDASNAPSTPSCPLSDGSIRPDERTLRGRLYEPA